MSGQTTYAFEQENDTLVVRWAGHLEPTEIDRLYRELKTQTYFHRGINTLWDFSVADLGQLNYGDADSLVTHFRPEILDLDGRIALLAPGDAMYGYSRMYIALATNQREDYQIQVFRNESDARSWIASGRT